MAAGAETAGMRTVWATFLQSRAEIMGFCKIMVFVKCFIIELGWISLDE